MSAPPPEVLNWLEERFRGVEVVGAIGGGCVNPAVRLRLPDGDAFLKYNTDAPPGVFTVEAEGLRALRSAAPSFRVPEVIAARDAEPDGDRLGWLLLEWLESGRLDAAFWERLGRGLAQMHRATADGWGWRRDGFIGPLRQPNGPTASWAEFWWTRRLEPQLRNARAAGWRVGRERDWEALRHSLPEVLAPAGSDGPSLLHGDLWSGNVLAAAGEGLAVPALVDPAAYHGHREVDLAMAELFGGFAPPFFDAYHEAWPLEPGYRTRRRAAYQLFYLLVHVNLFGAAYLARTERALQNAIGAG